MKAYNCENTIQLIDPPYIGTEKSCWSDEIVNWYREIYENDEKDLLENEEYVFIEKDFNKDIRIVKYEKLINEANKRIDDSNKLISEKTEQGNISKK